MNEPVDHILNLLLKVKFVLRENKIIEER